MLQVAPTLLGCLNNSDVIASVPCRSGGADTLHLLLCMYMIQIARLGLCYFWLFALQELAAP
jgi:hypothetical protein